METKISSATKEIIIGNERPTVLIGERINPTGRKRLSEALQAGNLAAVRQDALAQVQAGADMLDVNVGAPGVDEKDLLPQAVQAVMETVDVPLCIDSANPQALEAALKVYKGKPLVNSVTGEEHSLSAVLPLIKKFGASVIGLLQDEKGIASTSKERLAIAQRILEQAAAVDIPAEDVIIDCVALAVAADTKAGLITLETIRSVKSELGVNMTLGASNFSFGLPDRHVVNNTFLALAIGSGVNCPIVDIVKVRPAVLAADLALGRDDFAMRYIKAYRERQT
jgi:5-methyltetrahydrofolate--homocysteine methyltransferase